MENATSSAKLMTESIHIIYLCSYIKWILLSIPCQFLAATTAT